MRRHAHVLFLLVVLFHAGALCGSSIRPSTKLFRGGASLVPWDEEPPPSPTDAKIAIALKSIPTFLSVPVDPGHPNPVAESARQPTHQTTTHTRNIIAGQPGGNRAAASPLAFPPCESQDVIREFVAHSSDQATEAQYQKAMQAYYDYRRVAYLHSGQILSWSRTSSKVIFFFVLLVISAGLYFAAFQFHANFGRPTRKAVVHADSTEIQASLDGIKVSSSVLGVVILALSLAFFYLYLTYVYPLQPLQ